LIHKLRDKVKERDSLKENAKGIDFTTNRRQEVFTLNIVEGLCCGVGMRGGRLNFQAWLIRLKPLQILDLVT
jgi:hypothetical protein